MALVVERRTSTTNIDGQKPLTCFTCKQRKTGLFTADTSGRPMCADCAGVNHAAVLKGDSDGLDSR